MSNIEYNQKVVTYMFASVNGTRIYFDIEGSGYIPVGDKMVNKPVLFAVHGGPGSDHSDFKPWLTPLSEDYQIVYIDQRCNGQSERVDPATCTFEQLADDIEALRLYLGLDKISVLGHSFGGMIAQVYASSYPASVDKLLLICTAPSHEFFKDAMEYITPIASPEQLAMIPDMFHGNIRDEQHAIEWWSLNFELYYHVKDEQIMHETGNRPIGSMEVANYTFKYLMPNYDIRPEIVHLTIPTLVVAGKYDWITPVSQAKVIHELIAGSQLAIFEHSGHMPFVEEQPLFIETVRAFLLSMGE